MILVTGAAGLVGTALVKMLLQNGEKVKALYHNSTIKIDKHPNLFPVKCDILDVYALEDAMADVNIVYHCAALISFNPADEKNLFAINVEGTANVVNACLEVGVKKIIHVSSVAALGRLQSNINVNEKMEWSDESGGSKYGHSKYLGEMEVWRATAEGLNAIVIYPSIILGTGDWDKGSSKIFQLVYNEFPWYTEGTAGFVDVADVAIAMIELMNSDVINEKYIVSAHNLSYKNLFSLIAKAFNKKEPSKKVTPFMASLIWRVEALKSKFNNSNPLLTRETSNTAQTKIEYDNSKLLKALPHFRYKKIEETIKEICNSFLKTE